MHFNTKLLVSYATVYTHFQKLTVTFFETIYIVKMRGLKT